MRSFFQKFRFLNLSDDPPETIVILRALSLADLLCAVPAFRSLRAAFPESKITLVGLARSRHFIARFCEYFDDFIEFPGYPDFTGREDRSENMGLFLQEVQSRRFDLALQMHGSGSCVNSFMLLFGAKRNAGFYLENEYCPDPLWFMPFPHSDHEICKYLQLMEFLGINALGPRLEFPITPQDEADLRNIQEVSPILDQEYVCIHTGARLMTRPWLADRLADVARRLTSLGLKIVLTGAPEDVPLVEELSAGLKVEHTNLAGRTSLGALAVLLRQSRLLISNDTDVSHIASALKVPSVVVAAFPVACRPCSYAECAVGMPCANEVEVDDVFRQAIFLLRENSLVTTLNY